MSAPDHLDKEQINTDPLLQLLIVRVTRVSRLRPEVFISLVAVRGHNSFWFPL